MLAGEFNHRWNLSSKTICDNYWGERFLQNTFQGSLFHSLSTDAYENEIDTLRQLDDSKLPIVTYATSVKNIFGDGDNSPLLRSLGLKLQSGNDSDGKTSLVEGTYCTIERFTDISIVIKVPDIIIDATFIFVPNYILISADPLWGISRTASRSYS